MAKIRRRMAYSYLQDSWIAMGPELREWLRRSSIGWRREPSVRRLARPTRIDRARRFGYKAKPGVVVVRVRVRRGGARKTRPVSGRRQKALGVSKFTRSISLQRIAENRAARKYPNLTIMSSYYLYADGRSLWYEVLLHDTSGTVQKSHRRPRQSKETLEETGTQTPQE